MGLVQVTTTNVTSNVASVSLTGIDDDSNYIVLANNIFFDSNDDMRIRFTVSGSADTSSNYDNANPDQLKKSMPSLPDATGDVVPTTPLPTLPKF